MAAFTTSIYSLHSASEFAVPAHIRAPFVTRKRSHEGYWAGPPRKVSRHSWLPADRATNAPAAAEGTISWGAGFFAEEEEEDLGSLEAGEELGSGLEILDSLPGRPLSGTGEEQVLAAEVRRIRLSAGGPNDFRHILDLEPPHCWNLQLVQSRYRQLMRVLHPDKRSKAGEALAGGRSACDEAVGLVQAALQHAKQEIESGPDPAQLAQESMRRMQEVERQRARLAMQRQQQNEASTLAEDVERALAEVAMPDEQVIAGSGFSQPDNTAQEIMSLLARLAPSGAES